MRVVFGHVISSKRQRLACVPGISIEAQTIACCLRESDSTDYLYRQQDYRNTYSDASQRRSLHDYERHTYQQNCHQRPDRDQQATDS